MWSVGSGRDYTLRKGNQKPRAKERAEKGKIQTTNRRQEPIRSPGRSSRAEGKKLLI